MNHTPIPFGPVEAELHGSFPAEPIPDRELLTYLVTGEGDRAPEIRGQLRNCREFRERARNLKLSILVTPTDLAAELIEEAVDGAAGDSRHPYLRFSGHVPSPPRPGRNQRVLRIISATDPTGRSEVVVPAKAVRRRRRKMRKSLTDLAAPIEPQNKKTLA